MGSTVINFAADMQKIVHLQALRGACSEKNNLPW